MRRRGLSLIEVVICAGLFLLAMTLCGQLAVVGMRTRQQTTDKNQAFREGTIMLQELDRDLAHATAVMVPTPFPAGATTTQLVLETYTSRNTTGRAVVGYTYDSAKSTLTRLIYDPSFALGNAASHVPASNERPQVCTWVKSFAVTSLNPAQRNGTNQVRCELTLSAGEPTRPQPGLTLMTEVEVRGR